MPLGGAPVTPVDRQGNPMTAGQTATAPSYERSVGSDSLTTGQAQSSVSPAAAAMIAPARAGRRAVTISNITGTQPVYLLTTNATTGVTTGFFLAGTAGATVTLAYTGAIYATSPTAAQTLSFMETY